MKTFADFYANGDYPNSLMELEKLRGDISPGVWHFNAGTLKAKMMNLPEARYHFLEAKLNGFQDDRLDENLSLVEEQLDVKSLEKPLELYDYAVKFSFWAQNGFFTMLSLLFLLTGLLILKRKKNFAVLGFTVFLISLPLILGQWTKSWDKAVTLSPREVMDGPSGIFGSRGELPAGILIVTRRSGDWKEILYPSRFKGWIKSSGLKALE